MNKPLSCQSCPIGETSHGFSLPHGAGTSGVVIVGDGLSYGDYQAGKVFDQNTGEGGKLVGTIKLAGAAPGQFRYTSAVRCFPPHGGLLSGMPYEQSAVAYCSRHLRDAIEGSKAPFQRVLLALGDVALRSLTGMTGLDSDKQGMKYLRGYCFESEYGWVVPSYHPRQLLAGNQHLTPCLESDIKHTMQLARGLWSPKEDMEKKEYDKFPSVDGAESYYQYLQANGSLPISYDIETAQNSLLEEDERDKAKITNATITQIQFSHRKHQAIVFPWKYPYIKIAQDILSLGNPKAGFNCWNFDNKVLEQAGGCRLGGVNHDLMWMWKQWQPRLHRNLQSVASFFNFPFPWKHLFESDVEFYGCADVDAPQYIIASLPKMMKDFGCWSIYERHLRQYYEVALRPASDMGIPVNRELHSALAERLEKRQEELMTKAVLAVPSEILPVSLTPKDGYKKIPKPLKELARVYMAAKKAREAIGRPLSTSFEDYAFKKLQLVRKEGKWYKRKVGQFSPNSSDQIKKYLTWMKQYHLKEGDKEQAKLYEIPTVVKKGVEKETTGKDVLAVIAAKTDDPILQMVLESRSIGKLLSNDLPNWIPASDGCVHTEWHFGPPTGQMGSRTPNVLNASKHTEVGQLFRRIIEAP